MKVKFLHTPFSLLLILWLCSPSLQAQRLSKSTYGALNNYIIYSNEATHAINLMYFDFLYLNNQLYAYVEDSIQSIAYTKDNILTNPEYFPIYPRELYPKIISDNIYLPYDKRGEPFQLVGKVSNVLKEMERTRGQLATYINSGAYQQDTNLVQGFTWLRRMEVLYYDMFTLQEKLHWNLSSITQSYTYPALDSNALRTTRQLQPLLQQIKIVIKGVRANDNTASLNAQCAQLRSMILRLEREKPTIIKGLKLQTNSLRSPDKRYDLMLDRARKTLKAAQTYLGNKNYQNFDFEPQYYYYNIDLLNQYNRTSNGVATLFNKFIQENDIYWLFEYEMPHLFKVRYPDIPAFEQYLEPELDIEAILAKTLAQQARLDSLQQVQEDSLAVIAQQIADSIAYREANPEIGDMNLNGFATNNLVFLLDISASMRDTNKLPLLKEALVQLLDLMREEDNITFITYAGKAQLILPPTSVTSEAAKAKILSVIDNLSSSGLSDANKGIKLAYQTIEESFIQGGNNRIIMATDGGFKVSRPIQRLVRQATKRKNPIRLSTFYFSQKEFTHHKKLLQELSETGAGRYRYIQRENAKKILVMEAQAVRNKKN
ncbi:MAG: vWA domain-containing protein [Aureispira sp.]